MKTLPFMFFLLLAFTASGRDSSKIETSDIENYWKAYDMLANARSKEDSIDIIQEEYIDRASAGFEKFIEIRKFTASEYISVIGRFPGFWRSVRPLTLKIAHRKREIESVLDQLSRELPGFKSPDICFAIGCLRTGGTTSKGLVLIGSEIAASDSSVDKSEFSGWLKSVIGTNGDIVSMVAHEAVHTRQTGIPLFELPAIIRHQKLSLLNMVIIEGSCDFITSTVLGLNINSEIHLYGERYKCDLYKEFIDDIENDKFDYSKWLYNGSHSKKDRPADLGYYIGYKIAEGFYNNSEDKTKALKTLLKRGRYKRVYKRSGFEKKCINQ